MPALIVSLICAYLLGAIPTAFIFGKLMGAVDIRKAGSRNVGATNVYRTVGRLPAALTLLIDIAKGAVAVSAAAHYFYQWGVPLKFFNYQLLLALAAVSGHNWTPFLKFKGGKGVATSAGVLLVICPKALVIMIIVWAIVFALTKTVSLASVIASISFPIIASFIGNSTFTLFAVILGGISVFKHRANIKRLISGQERSLKL